ncbi:MAG TPA: glycosyltransferase family 2 protein [Fibrobacteria bacterium]|nr:glycosyltransferase family 2 protein [Fibrobacteria bacterium]
MLSIIIVSFQGRSLLEQCLRSISTHLDGLLEYDVWVVDNASTDGTVPWLGAHAAENPKVTAIFNDRNLGFAAANNAALRRCRGEFILLLNNDALLVDASVMQGMDYLRKHPASFGAGGLLMNGDGTPGPSYGFFPSPGTLMKELLGRKFGALRAVSPAMHEGDHPIDFPCGAYFLVRRELLGDIGLLDEDFFLYFEETEWAARAWRHGRTIQYLPFCKAIHLGGGSSENREPLPIIATFYESWRIYLRKTSNPFGTAWVFLLLLLHFSGQAAWSAARGRGHSAQRHLKHARGTLWGWLGKPSRRLSERRP